MRANDEEVMEGMQPKVEENNNKHFHPWLVCGLLWWGSLLFMDNSSRSTLFTRLTARHSLLHMFFAKNVLGENVYTEKGAEERSGCCHRWFSIRLTEAWPLIV